MMAKWRWNLGELILNGRILKDLTRAQSNVEGDLLFRELETWNPQTSRTICCNQLFFLILRIENNNPFY